MLSNPERYTLDSDLKKADKEIEKAAAEMYAAVEHHSRFMELTRAYNLLTVKRDLIRKKLANVRRYLPSNGYQESYEMSVQMPRGK
jgi:hypothetical protein